MLVTFYRTTSQGTGCLHMVPPPPQRRNPPPPGPATGKLIIRYDRCWGLAQAIQEVECGGLYICSLTETIWTETCLDNWWGYDMRRATARTSHVDGAQGGVVLGSRYQLNGRGRKSMRFHGMNVGSYDNVLMLSDGLLVWGLTTVWDEVLMVVLGLVWEANESHWAWVWRYAGFFCWDLWLYKWWKNLWVNCQKTHWLKGRMRRLWYQDVVHEAG